MSRTETLDLLKSVIDRLEPIGQMTPGTPLRATDWNIMVEAVTNLARLVSVRERSTESLLDERYAPIQHEHQGQVTMSWFEPATRALIEKSQSGSVEQQAALIEMRKSLDSLRSDFASLRREITSLRVQVDGLRDEGASRRREFGTLALRVESLADVEKNLAGLNDRFGGITTQLEAALDFRNQLVDEAGNPINLAGLQGRITTLEDLPRRLRTADGAIVNIREFESVLARLEADAINRNDVDNVILQRLRTGNLLNEAGLITSVSERVSQTFNPQFEVLNTATLGLSTQLSEVSQTLTDQRQRITQVETNVTTAQTSITALSGLSTQVATQGTRLNQVESRLQVTETVVSDLPTLRQRLTTVESRSTRIDQLSVQVETVTRQVDRLEGDRSRLEILTNRVEGISSRIQTLEQDRPRLTAIEGQVLEQSRLLTSIGERVTLNEAELSNVAVLPEQVRQLSTATQSLTRWQMNVDTRLIELSRQRTLSDDIVGRVSNLEGTIAENNTTLRRIDQSVGTLQGSVDTLQPLSGQVSFLSQRLVRLERPSGGDISRPIR